MKRTREYHDEEDDDFSSESEEFYHQNDSPSPPPSPPPSAQQPPQMKHFCVICNKQFGSGKAYGGHVRIHSLEYCNNKGKFKKVKKIKKKKGKRSKRGLVNSKEKEKEIDLIRADVEGKIRCCLCGKEFQTMHSLFGHMRRHPGRSWKGVRPPPSTGDNNSNLSFMYDDGEDDDVMSRSMVMSDEPEEVHECACNLMMLRYAQMMHQEAMELANLRKRYERVDDKSLIVDMKIKMEIEVDLNNNPRDDKDKRSLGFDLNQPYHEDYDSYWN